MDFIFQNFEKGWEYVLKKLQQNWCKICIIHILSCSACEDQAEFPRVKEDIITFNVSFPLPII